MTHPADADAQPVPRWAGWLAVTAAVGIAVGLAAGWTVLALTRPSDDDLQRAVLDEIGLPAELEAAPVVGPALDTYTHRIERRVLDETRPSATLALSVGVIVGVTGTVTAHAAAARIRPARDQPPHDDKEVADGRRH